MSRPQIIAVDFDGTIVEQGYPNIGEIKQPVVDFLNKKKEEGAVIILWTTRNQGGSLEKAKDFVKEHDIPIDYYNSPADETPFETSPKVFADLYIDDRAIHPSTLERQAVKMELVDSDTA